MKRIISWLFAIIVLCCVAASSLLLTSTGNRWLWQLACEQLPSQYGKLQGELVEGSLLRGWQFRTLSWHRSDLKADFKIDIRQLSLSLSPERLLRGELFIEQLSIERIEIENLSTGQDKEQGAGFSGIEIPSFTMPLPVEIKTLNIRELGYFQQDYFQQNDSQQDDSEEKKVWLFQNVGLSARAEKQTFSIQQFEVTHDSASLQASASITLSAPYPVSAQLTFSPGAFSSSIFSSRAVPHDKLFLPDTSVSVSGYLTDYQIELSSQPGKEKNSTLLLNGALSGSLEQLFVHSLDAQWQQQAASVSGQLSWQHGIEWQGALTFRDLNPGLWLADYPGQLSGTVTSSVSAVDQEWEVEAQQLQVSGLLRGFPVALSGQLMVNSEETVRAEPLQLDIGSNRLNLNGYIDQDWNLKGVIDAPDLTELYPPLSGNLSGDFELTGSRDLPNVAYRLMAEQLAINKLVINGLRSEGELKDLKALDNQAHLQIDSLTIEQQSLQAIEIAITGNPKAHQLSAKTEGKVLSGHLQLEGSLLDKHWSGQVKAFETLSLLGQWDLQKAFTLRATQQEVEFQPFCLISPPASFCLGKGKAGNRQANINFELKQLDVAQFTPLLPEGLQWQSELNASGKVVLREGKPSVNLNLHTPGGQLNVAALEGEYDKLVLNAVLGGDQLNGKLEFESPQLGNADLSIKVTDIEKSRLLDGQLTIDHLLLEIFQPFIPGTRHLSGVARAGLQMRGSLHNPLLQGEVVISEVALNSEFCDISRINSRMQIQGDRAVVSSQLQVGEGLGDINGTLSWKRGQFTGLLHLTGNELHCSTSGFGDIWASPDLSFNLTDTPLLSGTLAVPRARIEIRSLPEQAITRSDDVRIVGRTETSEDQETSPIALNTTIELGDDVRILAYGLTSKLAGMLTLTQSDGQPLSGQGSVQLVGGRYRYLGQDLIIKQGQIIFQGPLSTPFLNLDAIRNPEATQDNVIVGVKVTGPVRAPGWSVYSTPTMPQQEQFSYLLRGRGIQAEGEGVQSILLGMGLGELSQTATKLGDQLGIRDFSVDTTGSGENTQVSVGGYIAPGLRLQYGTGVFNSVSEVKIRYEVIPRVYLQAVSGLAQALDVFYRFEF